MTWTSFSSLLFFQKCPAEDVHPGNTVLLLAQWRSQYNLSKSFLYRLSVSVSESYTQAS